MNALSPSYILQHEYKTQMHLRQVQWLQSHQVHQALPVQQKYYYCTHEKFKVQCHHLQLHHQLQHVPVLQTHQGLPIVNGYI